MVLIKSTDNHTKILFDDYKVVFTFLFSWILIGINIFILILLKLMNFEFSNDYIIGYIIYAFGIGFFVCFILFLIEFEDFKLDNNDSTLTIKKRKYFLKIRKKVFHYSDIEFFQSNKEGISLKIYGEDLYLMKENVFGRFDSDSIGFIFAKITQKKFEYSKKGITPNTDLFDKISKSDDLKFYKNIKLAKFKQKEDRIIIPIREKKKQSKLAVLFLSVVSIILMLMSTIDPSLEKFSVYNAFSVLIIFITSLFIFFSFDHVKIEINENYLKGGFTIFKYFKIFNFIISLEQITKINVVKTGKKDFYFVKISSPSGYVWAGNKLTKEYAQSLEKVVISSLKHYLNTKEILSYNKSY